MRLIIENEECKAILLAKHLCIYQGNGRDDYAWNERWYSVSHSSPHYGIKVGKELFPGWIEGLIKVCYLLREMINFD